VALASNSSGYPLSLIGAYALALASGISEEKLEFLRVDRVVEKLEGVYTGYRDSVGVRVKRAGDVLVVEDLYERRAPLTLTPERIEENYALFYVTSLYTRIPVEFHVKGDTVVMIYERCLLVKKH